VRGLRGLFLGSDGTPRSGWRALLFLAAGSLLDGSVMGLLRGSGLPALADWPARPWVSASLLLLASWCFLRLEGKPLASIGLKPGWRWGRQFLAGAAGGLLLMVLAAWIIHGLDGLHWVKAPDGGTAALGSGACLFLAVALREELFFRGYAFQRLVDGAGAWPALGVMAAYFVQAHWGNPGMAGSVRCWASLNIGLAGILLGLCYLKTRSLAAPIGLHLGWNWAQGSLLGFGVSGTRPERLLEPVFHGRPSWLTGGAFGLEASLPCAVLCGLAIAGLALWKPRER